MATLQTGRLLSCEEFEARYADAPCCELERGEVITLSPGGLEHSRPSMNVAYLIESWARRTRSGRVYSNEAGLITQREPDTVRGADVAYFSHERLPIGKEPAGFSSVPPNLVVEIVGRGQGWSKLVEKAGEYLQMGVDRVWIVNPQSRTVHVLRPDAEPQRLDVGQTIANDPLLPGFECSVAAIFEA